MYLDRRDKGFEINLARPKPRWQVVVQVHAPAVGAAEVDGFLAVPIEPLPRWAVLGSFRVVESPQGAERSWEVLSSDQNVEVGEGALAYPTTKERYARALADYERYVAVPQSR
jgi:hypothetical protein